VRRVKELAASRGGCLTDWLAGGRAACRAASQLVLVCQLSAFHDLVLRLLRWRWCFVRLGCATGDGILFGSAVPLEMVLCSVRLMTIPAAGPAAP
jgi:hypothetical protein